MIDAAYEAWVDKARSVRIESELARRAITLKGKPPELAGPCPVCGGTDRFSVHTKKQVFNCRGCGGKGNDAISLVRFLDRVDFLAAVERLAGEPKPNGKTAPSSGLRKVVAWRFDYTDEIGALLYQVERVEFQNPDGSFVLNADRKRKKAFRQRRPDPDHPGEWIWNLDGIAPVPYRLPELVLGVINGLPVIIAEGEAKIDLLCSWGFAATCNSGGAGKWGSQHSSYLHGTDVVILPDNDQGGRKHLDTAAASLKETGADVRALDLPGLGPKGDVIDWAKAGGTAEQLHNLIASNARPWVPPFGHDDAGDAPGPDEPFFNGADEEPFAWLEPKPLADGLLPVAAFGPAFLPEAIAAWVMDISDRMQCPPDFVAIPAMVALGSVIGRKVAVRPQRKIDCYEVPNLWGCIVGRPGAMKSPAMDEALKPLHRLEAEARKANEAAAKDYEIEVETFKLRKEDGQKKGRAALKEGA